MLLDEVKKSLKSLPNFHRVVVGVSGGADSVALASILKNLGYDIIIAHLNHSLRGKDSDGDEIFIHNLAKQWGVPFVSQKINIPKKDNLENRARMMRYDFLEEVRQSENAEFIAVAHHSDDQIETILMHMERGAGLRGISGMSLISGKIIRPLLTLDKQKLLDYLKKEKQDYRTDDSNFDINFKRNYFRQVVIPELSSGSKDFIKNLLHLSDNARAKISQIEKQAKSWISKNIRNNTSTQLSTGEFKISEFLRLDEDTQSEVIFALVGHNDVYSKSVKEIKSLIKKGSTGKQKKISGLIFKIQYGTVAFNPITEKSVDLPKIKLGKKEIRWGDYILKYLGSDEIFVRSWKSGDSFQPAGVKGSKKLQDFFVDRKIPKSERIQVPIIVDSDDKVLSVADFRVAENAVHLKKLLQIKRCKLNV
jgi:tRNA(Ile)-lysidine synthase